MAGKLNPDNLYIESVSYKSLFFLNKALANAYAICHNVQDLLYLRGFTSKPAHVKRGKKGGKKKKKK